MRTDRVKATEFAPKAGRAGIAHDQRADAVLATLVRTGAGDYGKALDAVMASDAPEGAHRARVALRRLRSVLKAGRPLCAAAVVQPLADRARDISRLLGDMRDADVMIGYIDPVAEPGRVVALREQAATTRVRVRLALGAQAADAFVAEAEAVFGDGGWRSKGHRARSMLRGPVQRFAEAALTRAWAQARAHGKRIDRLGEEDRHDFRKDMKTLRYLLEYFAPLWRDQETAGFLSALRRLQDHLGILNDLALLDHLQIDAPTATVVAARAERRATVLGQAQADWKTLRKLGAFW